MPFFFLIKAKSKLSNTTEPPWYSQCDFLLMETMGKLLWGLEEAQIYFVTKICTVDFDIIKKPVLSPHPIPLFFPNSGSEGSWLVWLFPLWVRCCFLIVYHIICGKLSSLATLGPASSSRGWRTRSRLYFVLTIQTVTDNKTNKNQRTQKTFSQIFLQIPVVVFFFLLLGEEMKFPLRKFFNARGIKKLNWGIAKNHFREKIYLLVSDLNMVSLRVIQDIK